jgi:hypothetical protein
MLFSEKTKKVQIACDPERDRLDVLDPHKKNPIIIVTNSTIGS